MQQRRAEAEALASDPLNPELALRQVPSIASANILSSFNDLDSTEAVGRDFINKATHPLLLDYGPAGVKFAHAIEAVLSNPDAPGLMPYAGDLWTLGQNLENGSDPQLTASSIAHYVLQGQNVIASLMGGEDAWNSLSPIMQNALSVQYYNQGPDRNIKAARDAARNGVAYEPRIGFDGAGANYVENEPILAAALTSPAYWVDQSRNSYRPADQVSGPNPFNPGGQLYTPAENSSVVNALLPAFMSAPSAPNNALPF